MGTRRWIWPLVSAVTILLLAGCGGVSTNVENPPAPAGQAVTIAFQPTPPTSVVINGTASVTAVVSNDPSNAGVDWIVTCQIAGNCGSLSSPHTASGHAQTYTPPASLSSNNQSVSILAFATADHTKNLATAINVNAYGNVLNGTYVVQTNGFDISGNPYQRVAAVSLDGNGGIASGEQTVNFVNQNTGLSSVTDPVIGGSYFIGADGRGTITINTADVNVGQQGMCPSGNSSIPCGVETFSLVVLSSSQVLLTKTDDLNLPSASNETSVGRMDLQTSTAAPTGGYAFVTRGMNISFIGMSLGGVLNINAPNAITGAGSIADLANNDGSGLVTAPNSPVSGTVSAPDLFGAVQINLTTGFSPIQFTAYVVDATHMALIESDDSGGAGFGVTAGVAIGQGAATGTFTANKSFAGTFAFGIFGQDSSGGSFSFLSSAGVFSASGSGFVTKGYIDEFQFQSGLDVQVSDGFHGTYTVDPTGTGRVDTNSSFKFAHAVNGTGPELVFYLTGKGSPALVLDADIEPNLFGAGEGTGIAYPVTTGAAFSGLYGLTSMQNFSGTEADSVGEMSVNGAAQTMTGVLDMNIGFAPTPNTTLTDGFQASAVSGRLTGTWTDSSFFNNPLAVDYYPIDSGHGFFAEVDGGVTGSNPGFMTFGFFSSRSPVCQGCP